MHPPPFAFIPVIILFLYCVSPFLIFETIPALGLDVEFLTIAGDEGTTEVGTGDVTDDLDVLHSCYLFVKSQRHGEEEFVILAAVEGAGGDVHIEFFSCYGCLVVERDALLVEAATHVGLLTDVENFGRETVADVNH